MNYKYRDFISSVGQSPKPHGISVVPKISPNMNPNSNERNIPSTRLSKPLLTRLLSEIIVPKVMDITGPIRGDTNIAATIFEALFSTSPRAAKELHKEILKTIK